MHDRVRRPLHIAVFAALAALSACGNHNQKSSNSSSAANLSAPADASGCASMPDAAAFGRAIKAAMVQIYGLDEAGSVYTVSRVLPEGCSHATVTYAVKGGAPQEADASQDSSGAWTLTLYGKSYPVQ